MGKTVRENPMPRAIAVTLLFVSGCASGSRVEEREILSAEDTLKKIVTTYLEAKTLDLRFTLETSALKFSGAVLLKDENKVRIEMSSSEKEEASDLYLISDGLKTRGKRLDTGKRRSDP